MWVHKINPKLTQRDVATIVPQYWELNLYMLPLIWFANNSFQMAMLSFSLLLVKKVYKLSKWTRYQTIVPQQKHSSKKWSTSKINILELCGEIKSYEWMFHHDAYMWPHTIWIVVFTYVVATNDQWFDMRYGYHPMSVSMKTIYFTLQTMIM